MPIYVFRCESGHRFDRYLPIKDYNSLQTCECGAKAKRQTVPTMIAPMFEDYESPIDGRPITSKRKRLEDLARSGCVPYEPSLKDEANKNIKNEELKLEKEIDKTVELEIEKMPARKRELLEQELKSGANIEYTRNTYG